MAIETLLTIPDGNIQGTVTSASVAVPAGTTGLEIRGTMTDAVASNPANSLAVRVEWSGNNGLTWLTAALSDWQGGFRERDGTWARPSVVVGSPTGSETFPPNSRVRGVLDVPERLRLGGVVLRHS